MTRLKGADTPIGFTIGAPNNDDINPLLVTHCQDLGVKWLRWQPYWKLIEPVKGAGFKWGNLDHVVQTCNNNGINITVTAMLGFSLPSWQSSAPASAADYLRYARAIADRYNGNNGVGTIQGVEIGNEDFDQGSGKTSAPLAVVMNTCYPPIKSAYPDLIIAPACSLQRNATHIDAWWRGMWRDASGHFDVMHSHYYTGIPGGSSFSYDPSVTKGNVPSFPSHLQIMQQAASDAGHANFPIWIGETGFAINNFDNYSCGTTVTTQATQRDYLKYELDQLKATGNPAKMFIFTMAYHSRGTPSCGEGTTQGMSLYQTSPSGGFTTLAYSMVKSYPKSWGGGSSIATKTRDFTARARVRSGVATATRDFQARARVKAFSGITQIKDFAARAKITGGFIDTFVRTNQLNWGTASGGLNWNQASGTAQPSIVSNRGQITGAIGATTMRLGSGTLADGETQVRVSVSRAGDIVGLTLRDQGLNQFIRLRLTASQLQINLQTPAGGFVTLASYAFAPNVSTNYMMKFRAVGADLRGKIWQDGATEPDWLVSANSALVSAAGQAGLAVSLSLAADIVLFDSYSTLAATQFLPAPTTRTRDWGARARIQSKSSTQLKDFAARARIVDLSGITVTTSAVKRRPLDRRFPKS